MKKKIIIILIIVLALSLIVYYLYYENNTLQVSNYIVTSDSLPNEFNNYKIVQISDFHNTKSKKIHNSILKEIKNIKPNIIVITGDLVDANKTDINTAINFIKDIKDIAPIYYVTGNHEAHIENFTKLKDELVSNNVIILDSKVEVIKNNGDMINLVGLDDPSFNSDPYREDETVIKDELKMLTYDNSKFTILLSHRPELIDTYAAENFNLVLSGHAHGGQIRIPFLGGLIAPNQGFFPKYTSGQIKKNQTTMIISRGIGNSIIPFRINNRPELVVITLQK